MTWYGEAMPYGVTNLVAALPDHLSQHTAMSSAVTRRRPGDSNKYSANISMPKRVHTIQYNHYCGKFGDIVACH